MVRGMMVVAALAFGVPGAVGAQVDSAQVSMDLALALLGGPGGGRTIFQHALPADLEAAIPLGEVVRVVGGVASGATGTVVVEVPGGSRAALEAYTDHLRGSGWRQPTPPRDDRGGFQNTSRVDRSWWCGEGYLLRPASLAFDGRTFLRIGYTSRESARTVCDAGQRRSTMRPTPFVGLSLPTLVAPAGATVRSISGGNSSRHIESEATIESALDAQGILDHYGDQLAVAGWVLQGRAIGDGVAMGRWEVEDDEGERLVGVMSVWADVGMGVHRAALRVERSVDER